MCTRKKQNSPLWSISVGAAMYISRSAIERTASTWCLCVKPWYTWLVRPTSELRCSSYVCFACAFVYRLVVASRRCVAPIIEPAPNTIAVNQSCRWSGTNPAPLSTHDICAEYARPVRYVTDFTKRPRNEFFADSQTIAAYALPPEFIRIVSF